ncbi:ECF-type sigma factor [Stieleria sp. ICT_E10.1]|uniref:ECF-type sigma factor n=1 Tax=Stieleria sedimenti TaxID=2976331 RepID=UPI00217FC10C|nr:ECF-type sigma factor [Stieleria sedimenti]MCS7471589.1 ECF-type sigma factor [Stieleria sedimenti]
MINVTRILSEIEQGDPSAAEQLLPLVYDELRKLAAAKLANEKPGQTLRATALVHDAYIRLVDVEKTQHWNSRGHFFGAAAEAMRRILVDQARRKKTLKHGGSHQRADLSINHPGTEDRVLDLVALDQALEQMEAERPRQAELVKLRFFAGLSVDQAAEALGVSPSTADTDWSYAKAWLRLALGGEK